MCFPIAHVNLKPVSPIWRGVRVILSTQASPGAGGGRCVTPMYGHDVAVTLYGAGLDQIEPKSAITL